MLAFYEQETGYLLRDSQHLWTPLPQLDIWINSARRLAAEYTGCLRYLISGASAYGASAQAGSMIPGAIQPGALPDSDPNAQLNQTTNSFSTIPGVERYPFGFANPYLTAGNAGVGGIIDVISVSVSWGGIRPSLDWMPWEDLQAYCRSYNVGVDSYPFVWATQSDGQNGEVWLFPIPSQGSSFGDQQGEMEWDVTAYPSDLYTDTDYEALPLTFHRAIKFGAASLSFMATQRYGMAQMMEQQFLRSLGVSRVASDRGKNSSFYQTHGT